MSRSPPVELRLYKSQVYWRFGRESFDNDTDRPAMGFAPCGHPENCPERASHRAEITETPEPVINYRQAPMEIARYAAVLEPMENGWRGTVPDFPGFAVTGPNPDETRERLRERLVIHLVELRAQGYPIPEPHARTDTITVPIEQE